MPLAFLPLPQLSTLTKLGLFYEGMPAGTRHFLSDETLCTESLQAAVSSGHAAGSRGCWGQRPPESLSKGLPKPGLQASDTERDPDALFILWEVHSCGRHIVSSLVGDWGQVGSAGSGDSHQ